MNNFKDFATLSHLTISSTSLCTKLENVNWDINVNDIQGYWNVFESLLIKIVDEVAPLVDFHGNIIKVHDPKIIKNKINKHNRVLKSFKKNPTLDLKQIM